MSHWGEHKERDKKADAAVGDQRAGEDDCEYRPLGTETLGHEPGDG